MGATSAEKKLVLPAFAMSQAQFVVFLQALRKEFSEPTVSTEIIVVNGIEKQTYASIDQLTVDSAELPDVVHEVKVSFANSEHSYLVTRSVKLELRHGEALERNEAVIKGETGSWVVAACSLINSAFWGRATIQGWLRLRAALIVLLIILFFLFVPVVNATEAAMAKHSAYGAWPAISYGVGFVCVAVFTLTDRLYYAAFPSTWIEIRIGPRRWPYETVLFIIGVASFILAAVALLNSA